MKQLGRRIHSDQVGIKALPILRHLLTARGTKRGFGFLDNLQCILKLAQSF